MRVDPPRRGPRADPPVAPVPPRPIPPPLPPPPPPAPRGWQPGSEQLSRVEGSVAQLDQALSQLAKSLPPAVTEANPSLVPAIDSFIKFSRPAAGTAPAPGGGATPPVDSFFDITYRIKTNPNNERFHGFIKMEMRQPGTPDGSGTRSSDIFIKFKSDRQAAPSPDPATFIKFGPRSPADTGRQPSDFFLKIDNAQVQPPGGAARAVDFYLKMQASRVKLGRVEFKV